MRHVGSVVVITGGGSGIGREIGNALWREGATVCLVGRESRRLESSIPPGARRKGQVCCYSTDITRDDQVRDLVKEVLAAHGRVNALVHSAGAFAYGGWESIAMEEFDLLYRTNLRAPLMLTKVFLPALRASRGQIVFVNSSAVRSLRPEVGAYSATKQGLRFFADSLREEINPAGVRVISVYPGRTATPMQARVCMLEGIKYRPAQLLRAEDVATAVINAMGMPPNAEVTDLYIRPSEKPPKKHRGSRRGQREGIER